VKAETSDEELLETLRQFRDALGDKEETANIVKNIGKSRTEVSYVLLNEQARPLLLRGINTSRGFRHSILMSTQFLSPAKTGARAGTGGRAPPMDVSNYFSGGNLRGLTLRMTDDLASGERIDDDSGIDLRAVAGATGEHGRLRESLA
jgi:hypothetical protein